MSWRKPLILLLTLVSINLMAQQDLDSLENALNNAHGEERVKVLNKLFNYYQQTKPTLALEYAKRALDLAQEITDEKGEAAALNNIGVIYKNQGVYDQALNNYVESLRISDKLEDKEGLASTLNNIGTVYSLKGVYDRALIYFIESYEMFEKLDQKKQMVGALNNIGNAYLDNGRDDKALIHYQQAIDLAKTLPDGLSFTSYGNMGNIHYYREEYDQALNNYNRTLEIERKTGDRYGEAMALSNIGQVYLKKNELEKAESYQNQALEIANDLVAYPIIKTIYKSMAEIYSAKGNYKKAYEMQQLYDNAKDYIYNEESSRRMAQIEVAFELQQKEKELEMLKSEREIQSLQVENSRIVIILGVMGSIIVIGAFFVFLAVKKRKSTTLFR